MKNFSLNAKISGLIAIFVVACIAISATGLTKIDQIHGELNQITGVYYGRINHLVTFRAIFRGLAIDQKNIVLEDDLEKMNEISAEMDKKNAALHEEITEWEKISSELGRQKMAIFRQKYEEWWKQTHEIVKLAKEKKNLEATQLSRGSVLLLRKEAEASVEELIRFNEENMAKASKTADADATTARALVLSISFVSIVSGILLAFFILRALSRSINQIISTLEDSSVQVNGSAQQIAASSEQLSQASAEQAASLEESSTSLTEMNSMIQRNAQNAENSTRVSHQSLESANHGKQVMSQMMQAMQSINQGNEDVLNQVLESNVRMEEIVKVISEIGNKTKVINDIVFQTKLLSFNASVEAARAGEHGKGFAVVAEEVGNLAQMSGNAAKEISSMLEGSIQKVEQIASETKEKIQRLLAESKTRIDSGCGIAQQCSGALEAIVKNVDQVTQMVREISAASKEQAMGINELTKAMGQLDHATQENAATSEEAASSAEELSAQAESMRRVVETLIVTIRGGKEDKASLSPIPHHPKNVIPFAAVRSRPAGKAPAQTDAGFKEAA